MREKLELIAVKDLEKGGVYRTCTDDLVQIRGINKEKNELHVYSIKECCNLYMNLEKHRLVKKIR